jgi:small subunit ribosomal protein S18
MIPRKQQPVEKKQCYFCQQNINSVDYKNVELLRQFVSGQAKIFATRRTGTCHKHQRILSRAVKQARFLALLPYSTK